MNSPITRILSFCALLLLAVVGTTSAKSIDAASVAKALEKKLVAGEGVSMAFTIKPEGRITITASTNSGKLRIESPKLLIVTDGTTIWNYTKIRKQVTVDALANSSALKDAADIFRLTENYTISLASEKGSECTLNLVPNKKILDLLKPIGEVDKLVFVIANATKNPSIKRASAVIHGQKSEATSVTILSVKKLDAASFKYQVSDGVKVIDLRE